MNEAAAKEIVTGLTLELGKLVLNKLIVRTSEPKEATPEPRYSGKDIAIAVSITRPIRPTVEDFLYRKKIVAEIVEVEGKGRLSSSEKDWTEIVSEFYQIILKIQSVAGAPTYHLFVSAPAALTFALGTVLGLNYNVHVYHWFEELNDYERVLVTSSKILK